MPLYKLNRDYLYRSTNGVLSFTKGVPTHVPPYMEKEVTMIGAELCDKDAKPVEVLEPETPVEPALTHEERQGMIYDAFKVLVGRNEPKDFTGAGVPTQKAVEKIVKFDVEKGEVTELWNQYKVDQAEAQ